VRLSSIIYSIGNGRMEDWYCVINWSIIGQWRTQSMEGMWDVGNLYIIPSIN